MQQPVRRRHRENANANHACVTRVDSAVENGPIVRGRRKLVYL